MYTFELLGEVDLRCSDGRRIDSILSQPKRLALLAMLALAAGKRIQRDELIGFLWPDSPGDRARHSLRQALHYLRRSLGPGVIDGKGEAGIGVVEGKLRCDVTDLLEAAAEGRAAEALSLYTGDLLPGFHLDDAPVEFERWLDRERSRIRRTAAKAAWDLAESEAAAGNAVAAGTAARRAYELTDWGEPALEKLIRLLARTGDVGGAQRAYRGFRKRLADECGREPGAAVRSLMEGLDDSPPFPATSAPAVSKREPPPGPRRVAPEAIPAVAESSRAEPEPVRTPVRRQRPSVAAFNRVVVAAASVVLLLWLGTWWSPEDVATRTAEAASTVPTLYLEPVRDLAFPDPSPGLAEALYGELAARLHQHGSFRIVQGPSDSGDPDGVAVRSSLRRSGTQVQLSALLLDPVSEAVLDRFTLTTDEGLSINTPEVLGGRLAGLIQKQASSHLYFAGLAERGVRPEVLSMIRGAAAEVATADSLRSAGARSAALLAYRDADSILARAQAASPEWAEPGARRAEVALHAVWLHLIPPHQDRPAAHQRVRNGAAVADALVERFPNDAHAREVRGALNHWAALTSDDLSLQRTYGEIAERDLARAVELDPGRAKAWSILSLLQERRGDFPRAYHSARRAYETDSSLTSTLDILVRLTRSAFEVGDYAGATHWCTETDRRFPGHWVGAYCQLSQLAWTGPWTAEAADSVFTAAVDRIPPGPQGEYVETQFRLLHAVSLAKAGAPERARELVRALEGNLDASVDLIGLHAWVETALGNHREARRLLTDAGELGPGAERLLRSRRYETVFAYAAVRSVK